jgi:hypothetical protein
MLNWHRHFMITGHAIADTQAGRCTSQSTYRSSLQPKQLGHGLVGNSARPHHYYPRSRRERNTLTPRMLFSIPDIGNLLFAPSDKRFFNPIWLAHSFIIVVSYVYSSSRAMINIYLRCCAMACDRFSSGACKKTMPICTQDVHIHIFCILNQREDLCNIIEKNKTRCV